MSWQNMTWEVRDQLTLHCCLSVSEGPSHSGTGESCGQVHHILSLSTTDVLGGFPRAGEAKIFEGELTVRR